MSGDKAAIQILLVTEQFPPLVGGASFYFFELLRRFQMVEAAVLTRSYPGQSRVEAIEGVNVYRAPLYDRPITLRHPRGGVGLPVLVLAMRKKVNKLAPNLLLCGVGTPSSVLAWYWKRRIGLPYIVFMFGEDMSLLETMPVQRRVFRRVVREARRVVVISKFATEPALDLGAAPERLVKVTVGVDAARFRPQDVSELRARLGLDGCKVLLTVSRLVERKGHEAVIRALPEVLREVPETTYLVVGEGNRRGYFEALARELAVEDRVIFQGEVPDEELPAFYNLCDLFVLPNPVESGRDAEGMVIVFLEAGACEKPVIGGRSGGAGETVVDGATGVLIDEPENTGQVAKAIVELLKDRQRAERMGKQGRGRVLAEFSWDTEAARLERILLEAVA